MSSQAFNKQPLDPVVGKLVVVGIGLIGGSLAAALKQCHACTEVIAIVRNQATGEQALAQGVADRVCLSVAEIAPELKQGDLIFIAVPTLAVEQVLVDIKASVHELVTLTDGASVKGSVADAARKVFGQVPPQLVLGHPIAGSEKSGVSAADPNLYQQHRVILTPVANTDATHIDRVTRMWQQVGAEVLTMSVAEHDEVLGATSHLPHAIAYSLVDTLAHDIGNPNIFRYAAGGFRDFTRIASSDPVMWHDIMRANREPVVHALDKFIDNLCRLKAAIESADSEYMLGVFTRAKSARDQFTQMLVSSPSMPADQRADSDCLISPGAQLHGSVRVPGELSSAVFLMVAAAIVPGSNLTLNCMAVSPVSTGIINILQLMGANITTHAERIIDAAPVMDIHVRYAPLTGVHIPEAMINSAINEFEMLCIAAACAQGNTRLTGMTNSERDRIETVAKGLQAVGVDTRQLPDGIEIAGGDIADGEIDSMGDYRTALAFTLAGIRATGQLRVKRINTAASSFEGFVALTKQMGISLEVINR